MCCLGTFLLCSSHFWALQHRSLLCMHTKGVDLIPPRVQKSMVKWRLSLAIECSLEYDHCGHASTLAIKLLC